MRNEVMHAFSRSISTIWLVNVPISAFGLFLVLFIRGYTLKRTIIRGGETKSGDVEKDAVATGRTRTCSVDDMTISKEDSDRIRSTPDT